MGLFSVLKLFVINMFFTSILKLASSLYLSVAFQLNVGYFRIDLLTLGHVFVVDTAFVLPKEPTSLFMALLWFYSTLCLLG